MSQNLTRKKAMIEALKKSLGVVTDAAKIAKIDRENHYRWMKEDEEYKTAVDNIAEIVLDYGESKMFQLIDKGDVATTIFFMKTRCKKRGYIEKTETGFTNSEGKDILPQIIIQPAPNCEPIKEQ